MSEFATSSSTANYVKQWNALATKRRAFQNGKFCSDFYGGTLKKHFFVPFFGCLLYYLIGTVFLCFVKRFEIFSFFV